MKMASVTDSPSGRVPEKASRWDHGRMFWDLVRGFLNIWEFIGLELGKTGLQGPTRGLGTPTPQGAPPALSLHLLSSGLPPKLLVSLLVQKKLSKKLILFGLRLVWIFCKTKNRQKITTGTGH
jgi:hypothetical protein